MKQSFKKNKTGSRFLFKDLQNKIYATIKIHLTKYRIKLMKRLYKYQKIRKPISGSYVRDL